MSSARLISLKATVLTALVLSAMDYSAAQPNAAAQDVDWLSALTDAETLSAAGLTIPEQTKIFEQIESTSFDVPDSWSMELRARRISLGKLRDSLFVEHDCFAVRPAIARRGYSGALRRAG